MRQLEPVRAARATEAARMIARRVTDPERVATAVKLAEQQTLFPLSVHWDPLSLAQGDTGQALLCAQLDRCFPVEGWRRTGHAHLARAVAAVQSRGAGSVSVFSGLSGLAFAAALLGGDGGAYRHLRGTLDAEVLAGSLTQAAALHRRHGMPVSAFDLISGLSGIATYLLTSVDGARAQQALRHALDALAGLGTTDKRIPGWHTSVQFLHDDDQVRRYPLGNLNCGLAHGIPGPLAVMALAAIHEIERATVSDAIAELAGWLLSHRQDDEAGPNWPTVVPLTDDAGGLRAGWSREVSRSAWCYGSPGIARALWLAGVALDDSHLREVAVQAMEAVYLRPVDARGLYSPTLCHGVAGLLQVTLRFAYDTRLPCFRQAASDLVDQILGCVDPDRLLGVADVEPAGNLVDQPGFLDGATGVALTLLAAATDHEPVWDRVLALS